MSNQSSRQQSIRSATGTELSYNGDWMAVFDMDGIAEGTFNSRLLLWLNYRLGSSHADLVGAQAAFAASLGFNSWSDINEITFAATGPGGIGSPIGLLLSLTQAS